MRVDCFFFAHPLMMAIFRKYGGRFWILNGERKRLCGDSGGDAWRRRRWRTRRQILAARSEVGHVDKHVAAVADAERYRRAGRADEFVRCDTQKSSETTKPNASTGNFLLEDPSLPLKINAIRSNMIRYIISDQILPLI